MGAGSEKDLELRDDPLRQRLAEGPGPQWGSCHQARRMDRTLMLLVWFGAQPGTQGCPHQSSPHGSQDPTEPEGGGRGLRGRQLWGPSTLPAPLAAAQNFLQKERAPGDETAWPHPSGSGRNAACTG